MRRQLAVLVPGVLLVLAAACNAITGEHDRILDDEDTSVPVDSGKPRIEAGIVVETSVASFEDVDTPTELVLNKTWTSPNGAMAQSVADGTKIKSFTAPANHPMLLAAPPPPFPTGDYKVRARIRADEQSEYGILVRGRGDNGSFSGFVLSSRLSNAAATNTPFLSPIAVATDNPGTGQNGPPYAYTNAKVWVFEVECIGAMIRGKIFREDSPAVTSSMQIADPSAPSDHGRLVGFYGYLTPNATLLEMRVTY